MPGMATGVASARIPQAVRERRKQLELSQAQAAKEADVSRRTWSDVETGRRHGNAESLAKIERALKMPAGTLTALDDDPIADECDRIRAELIDMMSSLVTREDLEQTRLDMVRRRHAALTAQLEQYEQEVGHAAAHEPLEEAHREG
jgi:transcriptional regulator with XRE-family HTH domain